MNFFFSQKNIQIIYGYRKVIITEELKSLRLKVRKSNGNIWLQLFLNKIFTHIYWDYRISYHWYVIQYTFTNTQLPNTQFKLILPTCITSLCCLFGNLYQRTFFNTFSKFLSEYLFNTTYIVMSIKGPINCTLQ